MSTRPNISESHSEISTRVPFCIASQAEDVLHDMGAISIIASDSQAMGRVGEVVTRTWQSADKMKQMRGALPEDEGTGADNMRIKRYIAKYTINPALAHGMSHMIGTVETGKLADLVLWSPDSFGAKPNMVIKGAFAAALRREHWICRAGFALKQSLMAVALRCVNRRY